MASTLILVPTAFERSFLSDDFMLRARESDYAVELCGFGPIVSGIRTSRLLAHHRPSRTILIGVAGAFSPDLNCGESIEFSEVACYGVGAGTGTEFISTDDMGWKQWKSPDDELTISDTIGLEANQKHARKQLLSCTAASASEADVFLRLKNFPMAVAEDMEGFSVAASCKFDRQPLRIIRGISNRVGDRNKNNWKLQDAMQAVEQHLKQVLHP